MSPVERRPSVNELVAGAARELTGVIRELDQSQLRAAVDTILAADRVFVAGAGRTGLVMRCFAMRLMHAGLTVFVVGETTTPAAGPGDLLVVGSGSGDTPSVVTIVERGLSAGLSVLAVTARPESRLGSLATSIVAVSGGIHASTATASRQPAGNGFEQALLLTLDAIAIAVASEAGVEFGRDLARHSNLE